MNNYVRKTAVGKSFFECLNGEQEVDIIILDMQFPKNVCGPIFPTAGLELIRKLAQNYRMGRIKKIPQIIGFSKEDFYEMYKPYKETTGKDMVTEFVGQGETINKVEELLKKVLGL